MPAPSVPFRLLFAVTLLALAVGCAVDLRRPPAAQLSTRAAVALVHVYQRTLGPWMPGVGIQCRFTPTCSRYAEAVLQKHGAVGGSWRALHRIARCGPWTPMGTVDEP